MASTAAFQPGPWMSTYYATKSYVLHFSEGVASELRGTGVTVSTLCPGPTATDFGEVAGVEDSFIFGLVRMTAARVAEAGYRGCMRGRAVITPGICNKVGAVMVRCAPRALVRSVVNRMQSGMRKPATDEGGAS